MNERAGAAVARAARGAARRTPAATDVTARGMGNVQSRKANRQAREGVQWRRRFCGWAAPIFTAPLCKNGDATRGPRDPHTVDRADGVQGALRVRWNEQLRDGRAVDGTKK
ncbi:MAG: hypothetical protein ABI779_01595 [Acidobacteriota bacterium]